MKARLDVSQVVIYWRRLRHKGSFIDVWCQPNVAALQYIFKTWLPLMMLLSTLYICPTQFLTQL